MNKKYIGILIIFIGVILIIAIVYFLFFYNSSQPKQVNKTVEQVKTEAQPTTKTETKTTKNTTEIYVKRRPDNKVRVNDLEIIASSFAERFGSFSNQSNYGNIRDLKIFMSDKMRAWADDFIKKSISDGHESSIYYGITTKALTDEVISFDDDAGVAKILVKTKKRESSGVSGNFQTFYEDLLVSFVKERGAWKVDSAFWQNKR